MEQEIGLTEMKILLSNGQTCSPKDLFFAGQGTCWSTLAIENILIKVLRGAMQCIFMDLHTGLGPTGFADILSTYDSESRELDLLGTYLDKAAFGEHRTKATGAQAFGTMSRGVKELLTSLGIRGLYPTIECGTQDLDIVLEALRLETALHFHGSPDHPRFEEIKRRLRDGFYADLAEWKKRLRSKLCVISTVHLSAFLVKSCRSDLSVSNANFSDD